MTKVYLLGNSLYFELEDGRVVTSLSSNVDATPRVKGVETIWYFNGIDEKINETQSLLESNIVDQFGVPYNDFSLWISENTGEPTSSSGGASDGLTDAELRATPVPVTFTQNLSSSFGNDAGGRTRVAQITTLLDGKVLNEDDTNLFENVGSGTATHSNNKVNLSVTSGQYIIRQSRRFCPYFAGKSQLIEVTFDNFQLQNGVIKRSGYFSSNPIAPYDSNLDGIWIESNGTNSKYKVICSRNGVETLNEDITSLMSGYNFQNFTVVAFDFLWLGGAIMRAWIKTENGFELLKEFNYSGTQQDVFILSPNQPIRYEIRSTTGSGSMRYVCSQVATEGSINEGGKTLAVYNTNSVTTNNVGTIYFIKSIRKQSNFRDIAVQILDASISNTATSDAGIVMLIVNPSVAGTINYTNNSKIQEGNPSNPTVPPTITAGTGRVVAAIPIGSNGGSSVMKENFLSFLSSSINNTMDTYVLAYMPTTSNQSINGVINLKEY